MAPSNAQTRFDQIFKGKTRPEAPDIEQPHFAELELIATSKLAQDLAAAHKQSQVLQDSFGGADAPNVTMKSKTATDTPSSQSRPRNRGSSEHEQTKYIGHDMDHGDAPVDGDEDRTREQEPESSSKKLLARYCSFALVLKFPYKYMQDPDDKVSQAFFAREQAYVRNWDL